MSRWSRIVAAMSLGSVLTVGRTRIGPVLRSLERRAELFAPRGARICAAVAPPPPARLASCAFSPSTTADVPLDAVIVAALSASER
jgi:hypothetical protein